MGILYTILMWNCEIEMFSNCRCEKWCATVDMMDCSAAVIHVLSSSSSWERWSHVWQLVIKSDIAIPVWHTNIHKKKRNIYITQAKEVP